MEEVISCRESKINFVIEGEIQVAKGDYHLPWLYLLKTEKDFLILHAKKGRFPKSIQEGINYSYGKDYYWKKIPEDYYRVLKEAVVARKGDYRELDNYTYIYLYCKLNGADAGRELTF